MADDHRAAIEGLRQLARQPRFLLRVEHGRVGRAQLAKAHAGQTDALVVVHDGNGRLPRVVAQQAEIRPQGGAQEAHGVACLVGDDVGVGGEKMHVGRGGAGRAQLLAHLVQMVAIAFVVACTHSTGRPANVVAAQATARVPVSMSPARMTASGRLSARSPCGASSRHSSWCRSDSINKRMLFSCLLKGRHRT